MKKQFGLILMGSVAFLSCTTTNPQQQLAETILNDTTLHQVDSMARSIISQGFNAGSGYSQIWARDMNTFIEVACEETNQTDIRNAILLFFALQQPNDEMIDGYVLKPDLPGMIIILIMQMQHLIMWDSRIPSRPIRSLP